MESFLVSSDFGKELAARQTSAFVDFRVLCREFIDCLIVLLVGSVSAQSRVAMGVSSFCPEMLLEGDDKCVFELFADLCKVLESCETISCEAKSALETFSTYVLGKRGQHGRLGHSASMISDVRRYQLDDFSFQSRRHVSRVFKLCCLVVGIPKRDFPAVTMELTGCGLSAGCFELCILLVQSYTLCSGYSHQSFFTEQTYKAVQAAVCSSGDFFVATGFSIWKDLCDSGVDAFINQFCSLYSDSLGEKRIDCEKHYTESNRLNLEARVSQVAVYSAGPSQVQMDVNPGKKNRKKSSASSSQGSSVASKKSNKKLKPSEEEIDPDIFYTLKKPSKKCWWLDFIECDCYFVMIISWFGLLLWGTLVVRIICFRIGNLRKN